MQQLSSSMGEVFLGIWRVGEEIWVPKNYSGPRVLTFIFMFIFAQQLPLSMGKYFWDLEGE